MINVRRVTDPPGVNDGIRILVDRLWPRGIIRDEARIDIWLKEVAPSEKLTKWLGKDIKKWSLFKRKYKAELLKKEKQVKIIRERALNSSVTLLLKAKGPVVNHAQILKVYLEKAD